MTNRITTSKLIRVSALLAVCGLNAGTLAAPKAQSTTQTQSSSISKTALQKLSIIHSSLTLEPHDEQLIAAALSNPMVFVERINDHEFTGQLIVHANTGKAPSAQARISPSILKSSQFVDEYVIQVPSGISEGELASVLMATGDYLFVEPNWKLFPIATTPNDSQFGSSWQHNKLKSTLAWDLHTGTSNITVAVCDSGVDSNHPDLVDALVPGYNAASNKAEVNGGLVEDINGHGTFVSGCAAAQGNNGTGVVGAGWDFRIMPIRVTNNSNGTANGFDLLEGSRWAVDNGAQAVNVSFSGGGSSGNQATAKYVIDRGGLLFWAAGNDDVNVPVDAPDLVLVGSTTSSDNKSWFSNYGPGVDLVAPGSSVRSTQRGGGYGNSSGTSFASPIAAGVGAMIFSVRPDLSGQDVQDVLYQSVDDLGAAGRDNTFGRGRVNTFNAMQVALAYEARLPLPIIESFDTASWMDIFSTTSGSVSTVVDAESAGAGSVLLLNSTDQINTVPLGGRTLLTMPWISYQMKASGVEAGESYAIEMLDNAGSWQPIFDYTSSGTDTNGYVPVVIQMTNEFRWHGVEVRITASGSDGTDQWMIDEFTIDTLDIVPVAPLVDSFDSGNFSRFTWEFVDGAIVDISNSTHTASFVGAASLESQDIPMFQFGIAPGYVRVDAWADPAAGIDDTVRVEVLNVVSDWIELGTLDGASLGTTAQTFEFETPITAWGLDTVRLKLTSAGNDPIYIDNVYVGPDQLSGACSDADFAEPYGELDFFDVSAFLSALGVGDMAADLNGDGTLDFFDVSDFLSSFGQGCP